MNPERDFNEGQISRRFVGRESKLFSKVKIDSKKDWVMKSSKKKRTSHAVTEVHIFTFSLQRFLLDPPCSAAAF
jgi:hypothetical protein